MNTFAKLIRAKLVAFGIPSDAATKIVTERQIVHQWGPKKNNVEYLAFSTFRANRMSPLELAEHVARVFHNWQRSYHVNTTTLATVARTGIR
jgi:hypothetical protein